jgi:hypothetical protein
MSALKQMITVASPAFRQLPSRERLLELQKLRCEIFQTSYNPSSRRTGAKYLRARLRGPSIVQYYPPRLSVSRLNKIVAHENDFFVKAHPDGVEPVFLPDEVEEQRLADVASLKARGKGKPRKAKKEGQSFASTLSHYDELTKLRSLLEESRRAKKKGAIGKKK